MKNTEDKINVIDKNKIEYCYKRIIQNISVKELLGKFKFSEDIEFNTCIKNRDYNKNKSMNMCNLYKVSLQNDKSLLFEYIDIKEDKYYNCVYIRNKDKEYEIG